MKRAPAVLQIVGGVTWPEKRKHRCQLCADTGRIYGDHDEFLGYCDCATGEAQRGSDGAA